MEGRHLITIFEPLPKIKDAVGQFKLPDPPYKEHTTWALLNPRRAGGQQELAGEEMVVARRVYRIRRNHDLETGSTNKGGIKAGWTLKHHDVSYEITWVNAVFEPQPRFLDVHVKTVQQGG